MTTLELWLFVFGHLSGIAVGVAVGRATKEVG